MPRTARFRIAAIADLFRQLKYAPRETRIREMRAAEALVEDIDPERNYPQEFVIFRITGYRPDRETDVVLVGGPLIGDLANLIQCLSDTLELTAEELDRVPLAIEEVAAALNVATRTVQRYRREGLICHYVVHGDGGKRLVCFRDALDRFVARHRARVGRAARFTRVDRWAEERIVAEARRLRETEQVSLNEAAVRIAREHGRAHETIRGILKRHDRRGGEPIFAEHGSLTERDLRLIGRAHGRGVDTALLTVRFGKSAATIRRAIRTSRAQTLRRLDLGYVHLPTFDLPDSETVILRAPPVTDDLDALLPLHDVLALIESARTTPPLAESVEDALVAGYNLLKLRAKRGLETDPAVIGSGILDRVETDLRWATRLKRRLVSLGLPAVLRRIERTLHRPLPTQPAETIVAHLRLGIAVASGVVETIDPTRGQHLERVVDYAVDRALATARPEVDALRVRASRAAARHEEGSIRLEEGWERLTPWDAILGLRRGHRARMAVLDEPMAAAITLRYGLGPTPPRTVIDVAGALRLPVGTARRLVLDGERILRSGGGRSDGATGRRGV